MGTFSKYSKENGGTELIPSDDPLSEVLKKALFLQLNFTMSAQLISQEIPQLNSSVK